MPFRDATILAQVVTSVVAGAGALWAAWLRYVRPRLRKRRRDLDLERNARIFQRTRKLIRQFRMQHGAQRTLCLSARNTGRPFPAHDPVWVSCIDQSCGSYEENTWERWQKWQVDPHYRELIDHAIKAGDRGILLITEFMEPSPLRSAYESQGTVASVVFRVGWLQHDNVLIYVSINFGQSSHAPRSPSPSVPHLERARELHANAEAVRMMAQAMRAAWEAD